MIAKKIFLILGFLSCFILCPQLLLTSSAQNIKVPKDLDLPEMVFVEGGTFKMGSNEGAKDEQPVHTVTVSSFSIGKYPVTIEQYFQFCDATDTNYPYISQLGRDYRWKGTISARHPIVSVSYNDALAYCEWLSKETGKKYRLPTEAEWEFAARGGNNSKGYKYAGSNVLREVGWYYDFENIPDISITHPVGLRKPNELGIYDMSGNVYEWCSDRYQAVFYSKSSQINPTGDTDEENAYRVLRGGSWNTRGFYCRPTYRYYLMYNMYMEEIGFRVVMEP